MKNWKSPGRDNIFSNILKSDPDVISNILEPLLNKIRENDNLLNVLLKTVTTTPNSFS